MIVPFNKKQLDISILIAWVKSPSISAYVFISEPMSSLKALIFTKIGGKLENFIRRISGTSLSH